MARAFRAKTDAPLTCQIKGNQIIITIGVRTLAYCYEHGPMADEYLEHPEQFPKVTDEKKFAQEVVRAMESEDEAGNNHLNRMFDKAIEDAIGDGCDGVDYVESI